MSLKRRDSVTNEMWQAVVNRDAQAIWGASGSSLSFRDWQRSRSGAVCIVELLDPSLSARCSGYQTVDHVKDGPMMGRRAPSDLNHLVAMCSHHNVESPPSKDLRMKEREYLGL